MRLIRPSFEDSKHWYPNIEWLADGIKFVQTEYWHILLPQNITLRCMKKWLIIIYHHENLPYILCRSMLISSTAMVEPLQGIVVGTGDASKLKPALFVVSCGEGHLDLRTADKVSMCYLLLC